MLLLKNIVYKLLLLTFLHFANMDILFLPIHLLVILLFLHYLNGKMHLLAYSHMLQFFLASLLHIHIFCSNYLLFGSLPILITYLLLISKLDNMLSHHIYLHFRVFYSVFYILCMFVLLLLVLLMLLLHNLQAFLLIQHCINSRLDLLVLFLLFFYVIMKLFHIDCSYNLFFHFLFPDFYLFLVYFLD